MTDKKKIVILGAGFGGLRVALVLGRKLKRLRLTDRYEVVLIDQNDYHTYTPTLYEVATTDDAVAGQCQLKEIVTFRLPPLFNSLPVSYVKARVMQIDVVDGDIHLESGTMIRFNHLVLALGSQVNYFGIPGLADHSLTLKTFIDALRIRERLMMEVEDPDRKELKVVVAGGGSTGVELAAEIKLGMCHIARVMRGACIVEVTVVEGAASILAPFGEPVIKRVLKRFSTLDVRVETGDRIASVEEKSIKLQSGKKIPFDILIWTGGVSPSALMSSMRMKRDQTGSRVLATSGMTCLPEQEDLRFYGPIYGIGDAVCFMDQKTGRPVPGVARAAIIQGSIVAHNILEDIQLAEKMKEKVEPRTYAPLQYPYIIPVGGKFAIARFGPMLITGFFGWILKGLVELNYLRSILPLPRALRIWLRGLWIFVQNDRLG